MSELPSHTPANEDAPPEDEPLLGRRGDATQPEEKGVQWNLFLGTATLAQAGIWILVATVWTAIFDGSLELFSVHPLANVAGLLFITQAILVLQPTHTTRQKHDGTWVHFILNLIGVGLLLAGLIAIAEDKNRHGAPHFVSVHARLGLVTYLLFFVQAIVGTLQYFAPGLLGGPEKAKAVYKYHRVSGYAILVLGLASVCAATSTDFNKNVLHLRLWVLIVSSVLIVLGLGARAKLGKLGWPVKQK